MNVYYTYNTYNVVGIFTYRVCVLYCSNGSDIARPIIAIVVSPLIHYI